MVMQKTFFALSIWCFALIGALEAHAKPDWTFAVYMEAGTPDMHYWVHKNMNDMALANSDHKHVNIVTQVHLEKTCAWRYLVRHHAIKPIKTTDVTNDGGQSVVDFMRWTVKNYPAHHYGLVLWGHGFGVLDPLYQPTDADAFNWDVIPDEPGLECHGGVCPLKTGEFFADGHLQHRTPTADILFPYPLRGLLFNDMQTFINNAAMVEMLKTIKDSVLKGKKLDILGTDCCKMAMLEVGYQARTAVDFLVGSQNCELKDGWNYKDFFNNFKDKSLDALAVAQAIVKSYGMYYEKNTLQNTYSLSALNLGGFDALVANLNEIVAALKKLSLENKAIMKDAVLKAREISPRMCQASYYIDLWSIYTNLQEELARAEYATLNADVLVTLKQLLAQGNSFIEAAVVANTTGTAVSNIHGISIYFPRNRIDESYLATPFAQETWWVDFLKEFIGQ